jgi:hypothetical protein
MQTTKWCAKCEREVPIGDWYRNAGRRDGLSVYCRPCYLAYGQAMRQRDRAQFLDDLGGRCVRCGFSDPRALQVDHVAGRNGQPRGATNSRKFYEYVLAHREEFQLLCANCNIIKKMELSEFGEADHGRVPPTDRVERPSRRWTPEQRAAQSAKSKSMFNDPEFRAKFFGAPNPRRKGRAPAD